MAKKNVSTISKNEIDRFSTGSIGLKVTKTAITTEQAKQIDSEAKNKKGNGK